MESINDPSEAEFAPFVIFNWLGIERKTWLVCPVVAKITVEDGKTKAVVL